MLRSVYWFYGRRMYEGCPRDHYGQVVYVGSTTRGWDVRCDEHWRQCPQWVSYASWPPGVLHVPDHIHLKAVEQMVMNFVRPVFNRRRADGRHGCSGNAWSAAQAWFQTERVGLAFAWAGRMGPEVVNLLIPVFALHDSDMESLDRRAEALDAAAMVRCAMRLTLNDRQPMLRLLETYKILSERR